MDSHPFHTMTRRDAVGLALGAVASWAAFPKRWAQADEAPVRLPFAFSLYGMRSLSIPDALRACREIGYDGVELALLPDWPGDPRTLTRESQAEIRQQLVDWKLSLAGVMENLTLLATGTEHSRNLDRIRRAAEVAHAVTDQPSPVVETVLGGSPSQWDSLKERMAERLLTWADVAANAKVTLAIKPHVSGALHTPEGAVWLLEQVNRPEVRLAYDFSHFQLRGLKLADTLLKLADKSAFVHVKDATGTAEKFAFLLPGETRTVDYAEYLRLLGGAGYRGSVTVEVSGMLSGRPGYDPIAAARTAYASLAPAFEKAGVRTG